MSDYQLQIRQVVDYPRCRSYRQFVQSLIADRSIRTDRGSGLFYYTVLCSYANESSPENNPTLTRPDSRKYSGIGELLMAFGIKLSINLGGNGDILFEAKTDALKEHYIQDFGAIPVGTPQSSGPARLLICDESAAQIFTKYLFE